MSTGNWELAQAVLAGVPDIGAGFAQNPRQSLTAHDGVAVAFLDAAPGPSPWWPEK